MSIPTKGPVPKATKKQLPKLTVSAYWQGGRPWGKEIVGDGPGTMHAVGCLVVVLTMAHNAFFPDNKKTPLEILQFLKTKPHVWDGDNLYSERAALELGLIAAVNERVNGLPSDPKLLDAITGALNARQLAIVWVSTDGNPNRGEHYILAWDQTPEGIIVADSALGKNLAIPYSLEKTVMWKDKKKYYQVVRVTPIYPKDQQ